MRSIVQMHPASGPVAAKLHDVQSAITALTHADLSALTATQRTAALVTLSTATRALAAVENTVIRGLEREAAPADLAGTLTNHLATALRISPSEAGLRIRDARDVGPDVSLVGAPIPARFPTTAAGVAAGVIDRDHVREIHRFFKRLPNAVPSTEREKAEQFLAKQAAALSPDQLRTAADTLLARLGYESPYSDADRARRRGFSWHGQDADGMSKATLWATPALRTEFDAIFGAWAAPGKCNPDDETPCVDGEPEAERAERDIRTAAQRKHDALAAVGRAILASGQLGSHNGLPVSVVATTTLQELENAAGVAHTGGGSTLPIGDLIKMAAHALHHLVVFDQHTGIPLYLGRSRRTASPGQRIVLHARDRGCSYPGCGIPGYLTEAHHIDDWIPDGPTNIDNLTFACKPHHRLVTNHGWTTTKDRLGRTVWHPPPQLELPGGTNDTHHPERYLE